MLLVRHERLPRLRWSIVRGIEALGNDWLHAREASVATKLKCHCLRKVDRSVRPGETEPGAAVRRPSDRSADGPGVPAWGGVWRPAPNGQQGLSSVAVIRDPTRASQAEQLAARFASMVEASTPMRSPRTSPRSARPEPSRTPFHAPHRAGGSASSTARNGPEPGRLPPGGGTRVTRMSPSSATRSRARCRSPRSTRPKGCLSEPWGAA